MVSELLQPYRRIAPMSCPRHRRARSQRLTLESPSRAPDGGGGAIVTWQTVGDVWASVRPISGDERLRADQVAGRITHAVVIRHRTDVTPAMRFRSGARVLEIVAVLDARPPQPPALPVRGALPVKHHRPPRRHRRRLSAVPRHRLTPLSSGAPTALDRLERIERELRHRRPAAAPLSHALWRARDAAA